MEIYGTDGTKRSGSPGELAQVDQITAKFTSLRNQLLAIQCATMAAMAQNSPAAVAVEEQMSELHGKLYRVLDDWLRDVRTVDEPVSFIMFLIKDLADASAGGWRP